MAEEILAEEAVSVVAEEILVADAGLMKEGEILSRRNCSRELTTKYEDPLQLRGGWTLEKQMP